MKRCFSSNCAPTNWSAELLLGAAQPPNRAEQVLGDLPAFKGTLHIMFRGGRFLAALIIAVLNASAAEEAPAVDTNAVTIDVLVAEALDRNPELKFYEAEIATAKAGRKSAGLWSSPELSGSVGQKTVRDRGLNAEGVAWSVAVVQPFEWPGRIGLRKAIANRDVELAELGLDRFKVALTIRMRILAYGLFAAQVKAAAAGEVAERFQALREVLIQRDPAGLTPLLETRVIEATELTMQRKASAATLGTQAALLELNQLRGLAPDTRLSVGETQLAFRPADSTATLVAMARTNNFELRLRAVELAQQGLRVELARNERFPAISVGPSFSEERAGERERIFGLGVSFPLPLWNRNSVGIETAAARRLQAEVSLGVTEREIQRKLTEAALTYETKRREIARWRPDSVRHFREAAELADRHYRLGAVPISTYVELQKQYLEAVEGMLETKKEALEAAAQLELLTGLTVPLASASAKEEKK
jgi:cobalt-zinc-cadmium efflux system outer membrane protein